MPGRCPACVQACCSGLGGMHPSEHVHAPHQRNILELALQHPAAPMHMRGLTCLQVHVTMQLSPALGDRWSGTVPEHQTRRSSQQAHMCMRAPGSSRQHTSLVCLSAGPDAPASAFGTSRSPVPQAFPPAVPQHPHNPHTTSAARPYPPTGVCAPCKHQLGLNNLNLRVTWLLTGRSVSVSQVPAHPSGSAPNPATVRQAVVERQAPRPSHPAEPCDSPLGTAAVLQ